MRIEILLRANAAYSSLAALVLIVGGSELARAFAVDATLSIGIGFGLLGWVVFLLWGAGRPQHLPRVAPMAAAGDVGWIVGAGIILAIPGTMSGSGKVALAVATVGVAVFAILQVTELRRIRVRL